ncbi:hypothetical protein ASD65_15710 [Microbacterium sp. Root61]|uniref:CPBP family intramembrane glutamic endopeptidase n=1 Tax=Microbacterium sp. Root61 TaxID=1736570 RepID=UPI0006F62A19|nr:CPBP family intramembrane glutamic endopeptidase [Microbacterium sp. Root61]KRA25707.1 hypothetical protein ASD65_15710 [Microbacterium sp. Root61]
MPDHSSDATEPLTRAELRAAGTQTIDFTALPAPDVSVDPLAIPAPGAPPSTGGSRKRTPRDDWRLGGRSVLPWREWLIAGALLSLGIGILLGTVADWLWDSPWAAVSATVIVWIGMLVPVVWALSRSRPIGLLRFRAIDLLYGVVLGGLLRVVQGWMEPLVGGTGALPSFGVVDGQLSSQTWLVEVLGGVAVAPVLEEFFFRGVILVALYSVLRRPVGKTVAGVVATVVSTGLFVLLHGVLLQQSTDQVIALAALGLVCGALVLLTGRIWGAVLVHLTFNAIFLLLALVGTYWA